MIKPMTIDGVQYYSVPQFARITHRTTQSVTFLIKYGNKYRKLRYARMATIGKVLILASELTEYPFTSSGRGGRLFHYDSVGNVVE